MVYTLLVISSLKLHWLNVLLIFFNLFRFLPASAIFMYYYSQPNKHSTYVNHCIFFIVFICGSPCFLESAFVIYAHSHDFLSTQHLHNNVYLFFPGTGNILISASCLHFSSLSSRIHIGLFNMFAIKLVAHGAKISGRGKK